MAQSPPSPYIVEPTEPHTYTIILLHGLGSNGEKFGSELLDTAVTSQGPKLIELLPNARWVFPTSRRRRSSAFRRSVLTQWFNIANLQDPSQRKELQLEGLAESAQEVLGVLRCELEKVPPQRIILGGLSQGCAMSAAVLLCLEHPIGGYIGMCGFFTYQEDLELAVTDEGTDFDDDDPFARDDDSGADEGKSQDPIVKAQAFERDLLGLDAVHPARKDSTSHSTPVFLGHGTDDEKVPYSLGLGIAKALRACEYQVTWKGYQGQGHWYKIPDEIDDIVNFIRSQVGWEGSRL